MSDSHVAIIDAEIETLQREREEAESKLRRLDAQMEFAKRIRASISASPSTLKEHIVPKALFNGTLRKPSQAVREYLYSNPGASKKTLLDAVEKMNLDSKSGNIRRNLDAILHGLLAREKVFEKDGGLYVESEKGKDG
jgi:hypothetical protein